MSEFNPTKKLVALGLTMGLGLSACGGAQHNTSPTPQSPEAKLASRFNGLDASVPIVPAENANYTKTLTRTLPDGTKVEVLISSLGVDGKGAKRELDSNGVDGITITVYPKGATIGQDKPDFGLDLGQEVNGTWDATYYQQFTSEQPYSVGELGMQQFQTSTGPGNGTNNEDNSFKALSVYKQVLAEDELVFNAFANGHNLASMPNIQ